MTLRKKIKPAKPSPEWEQGANARRRGAQVVLNPFARHTSQSYRWREGWEYQDQEMKARARRVVGSAGP